MTETLRYWIEQSEHECDKSLPIGSCLACDLLQLERELATVTEQRDNAIEMGNRTRDNSGAIIASQVVENIMLTQQRDKLAEEVVGWEQTACDKLSEICRHIEKTRIVTEQRDRLATVLQSIRDGYGGQITDPDCGCEDCEFLIKIDTALTNNQNE